MDLSLREFIARVNCDGTDYHLAQRRSGHPVFRPETTEAYDKLRKWLDEFPAEPVQTRETDDKDVVRPVVGYYLHMAQGGPRRPDVVCRPLDPMEFDKRGKRNWVVSALNEQLARLQGQNDGSELHAALIAQLADLASAGQPGNERIKRDCGNYLLTYQGADGKPRLIWCWAHQRNPADVTWADTHLCPDCHRLFLRRRRDRGRTVMCPACGWQEEPAAAWWKLAAACLLLLLLLLAAVLWRVWPKNGDPPVVVAPPENGHAQINQPLDPSGQPSSRLTFEPAYWEVPVGAVIQPRLLSSLSKGEPEDVAGRAVYHYQQPDLVERLPDGVRAQALSPGRTVVTAHYGGETAEATVVIQPPANPQRLRIEPTDVTLGVHATQRFRVFGRFETEEEFELTPSVEWRTDNDQVLFLYRGLAEGLRTGRATVQARYRASRENEYVTIETPVTVSPAKFVGLELVVEPAEIAVGSTARLILRGKTDEAGEFSLLESSRSRLRVEPPQAATIDGEYLTANRPGKASVIAALDDLESSAEFQILRLDSGDRPAGPPPVDLPQVRLAAVRIGPNPAVVGVEDAIELSVYGRPEGEEEFRVRLAADQLDWPTLPDPGHADFDPATVRLTGKHPTGSTPLTITVRHQLLEDTAQIDVVAPPFQLVLQPEEPVDLPMGQQLHLEPWAVYAGGRRAALDPITVEWRPAWQNGGEELLSFDQGKVTAVGAGSAQLGVRAKYLDAVSNEVTVRAGSAGQDMVLQLTAEPQSMLVRETGRLTVSAVDADGGAVDLPQDLIRFESSRPEIVVVDQRSGGYRALAAGEAVLTATHPAAAKPTGREITVLSEELVRLEFRPDRLTLAEGTRQAVDLVLVSEAGERSLFEDAAVGEVVFRAANPDAVAFDLPWLQGMQPSEPFEVSAAYLEHTATATVEVIDVQQDDVQAALRIEPAKIELPPGGSVTPRVQMQLSGTGPWLAVDPNVVQWQPPQELSWHPGDGDVPPALKAPPGASGEFVLSASHGGLSVSSPVRVAEAPTMLQTDAGVRLEIVRIPDTGRLSVGQTQHYSAVLRQGDQTAPAEGVQWSHDLPEVYVQWQPPRLTAVVAGGSGSVVAFLGDLHDRATVATVEAAPPPVVYPRGSDFPPPAAPTELTIASPQGREIVLPVGTRFDDYQVTAHYADGSIRDVTAFTSLAVQSEDVPQPLTVRDGALLALAPGSAAVTASMGGQSTSNALQVSVDGNMQIDRIAVSPDEIQLTIGQRASLRAYGYSGERSLGDITDVAGLVWKSRAEEVVAIDGPLVTGLAAGDGGVTAQLGSTVSNVAQVRVTQQTSSEHRLTVTPEVLAMHSGQSARLGRDVVAQIGGRDVTEYCEIQSLSPDVVRFDRDAGSFEGGRPAEGVVSFHYGGETARLLVRVHHPEADPGPSSIEISPPGEVLVVGQSLPLRVFQVFPDGRRLDRTGAAVIRSSAPAVLEIVGQHAVARQAGTCRVAALLPDLEGERGQADFSVIEPDDYRDLLVSPSRLELLPGQRADVSVTGTAGGRRHQLNSHHSVQFSIEGPAASVSSAGSVRGLIPGQTLAIVRWEGREIGRVSVAVLEESVAGIAIEPVQKTIHAGDSTRYEVFLLSQHGRRWLGPDDGVILNVADPGVATPARGLQVLGQSPGRTQVTARYGAHHATSVLRVVPAQSPPPAPPPVALRFSRSSLQLGRGAFASAPVHWVMQDGSTRDVSSQVVLFPAQQTGVVRLDAYGPGIRAAEPGLAMVHARLGELTTGEPLAVEVLTDRVPVEYHLEASPRRVKLQPGETGGLQRVAVHAAGVSPVPVAYRLASLADGVVKTVPGNYFQGVAPGRAQVQVTAVAPDMPFDGLTTTVLVDVAEPPPPKLGRRLVLSGPAQITAGQTAAFEAVVYQDSQSWPVTQQETSLVVTPLHDAASAAAEPLPGCRVLGKKPGAVSVKARHGDLISNAIPLRVVPSAGDYSNLVLVLDDRPMHVGESRGYRLLARPADGGTVRDLTHLVSAQPGTGGVFVTVSGTAVAHHPPLVTAAQPGLFTVQAEMGGLRSNVRQVAVIETPPLPPQQMRLDPPRLTLGVGSETPPLRVWLRHTGAEDETLVDASLTSGNPGVLQPTGEPGRFRAVSQGTTFVEAVYSGATASGEVQVVGNRFLSVVRGNYRSEEGGFYVDIEIEAAAEEGPLEYRVVRSGGLREDASPWTPAKIEGDRWKVRLPSPRFPHGAETYQALIEARDSRGRTERYPHTFRVTTSDWRQDGSK